jgi:alkanesulfonate monooxygenase SsuD/methylene tetrahydromethanopterin reductase-like flavin-dependent oxidoreductase (luciferase family)
MVAVQVIAAETDAAAWRLFTTPQQRFLRLIRNQPVDLLPPVDSMEPLWQDYRERTAVESKLGAAIVGSNATVKAGLEKLVGDTEADEVIVVTDTYEHADRLQSYRRVAEIARMMEVKPNRGCWSLRAGRTSLDSKLRSVDLIGTTVLRA